MSKLLDFARLAGQFTGSDTLGLHRYNNASTCRSSILVKPCYMYYFLSSHKPHCNSILRCGVPPSSRLAKLVRSIENEKHREDSYSLLTRFFKIFDSSNYNIADTSIHHVINTITYSPPACKPYPQLNREQAMCKLIPEFLRPGLISESHSPYLAPAVLVKKKDDSYRFVVYYKKLNLISIKDLSPLSNMEDTLRKLGQGYSYFSKLDLKSGFYQIPIKGLIKKRQLSSLLSVYISLMFYRWG